jgi:flagellar hook assembly protein FlgD
MVSQDFETHIYPNPAINLANITFENPDRWRVLVQIFDNRGALVNTVFNGSVDKGKQNIVWSAIDQGGNRCPNGIYYCRIICGELSTECKIILMK